MKPADQTPTTTEAPVESKTLPDNAVELDTPIRRGATEIDLLTIRKPNAGELRGLQLSSLLQLDAASLVKLLPRIAAPSITEAEANAMDPADLLACGTKVIDFLLQKQAKANAYLTA
ncbi:phage tail assembly protein [Pseudomonas sp. C9-3]|uniref:phage tail assembly protein n=1 Tax=Pseudomonas sp. C9-3 TaxID=3078264 RepID=UPI0028EF54B0|nr:phage tail assembly protein [Pseudomonas sp. C9-3]